MQGVTNFLLDSTSHRKLLVESRWVCVRLTPRSKFLSGRFVYTQQVVGKMILKEELICRGLEYEECLAFIRTI